MDQVNITGVSMSVDFGAISSDQVHWEMKEAAILDVTDVQFKMKCGVLNYLVKMMHGKILSMVKENLPQFQSTLGQMVKELNEKLKSHDPNAFMINVLNDAKYPLNMTMTEAP